MPPRAYEMPPRAYVLIFVCWTLITIITPTLIFMSANANANGESQDLITDEVNDIKSRRMMSSIMKNAQAKNRTNATIPLLTTPQEVPVPTPSPLPMTGIDARLWVVDCRELISSDCGLFRDSLVG
ncbi:hypothetical protein FCM35_KLT18153 [Carex littledalei]|uniref:Uncharacterized protein n=1 Tax=Carex littledalei TaxID=544730 RepID=A0A833RKL9_9POAL|nr:hypothetical protein FCM35_KLT18153 [Carex littledalei]